MARKPARPAARAPASNGRRPNDDIGEEMRLKLYHSQFRLRQAEQRAYDLFLQNLVKGTSHLSLGQEAIAAGFACAMIKGDHTFCTYRGHAHTLARGVPVEKVLGELMQRDNGLMRGKGGSMHLTSAEHGVMGSYAIIGAHLPIACGAALRAQYKGDKDVTVCFFGDGTTNIGAFHEALNFAAIWKLPVVFVCENNYYMEYTPIGDITAVPSPAGDRASAYGLPKIVIDGNDADVVYRTAQEAFAKARDGHGPSLIECLTYRHSGHSRADPGAYRPEGRARALEEGQGPDQHLPRPHEAVRYHGGPDREDRDGREPRSRDRDRGLQGRAQPADGYPVHRCLCRWRLGMAELTYREAVARGIAQEMTRDPDVIFFGEDVGKAGGVFKSTVGLFEQFGERRVKDCPISEQAILGAAMGAAMTGPQADRRDHVLGFLRGVLRLHRERVSQEPLHEQRAAQVPSGGPHRQRCGLALRRAAFAERRKLGDDDPGAEGGCALDPARRDRPAGGRRARSRPGDLLRAQVALRHQGRGAGRRDRRHARHGQNPAARQGRDHPGARPDGSARARSGRNG